MKNCGYLIDPSGVDMVCPIPMSLQEYYSLLDCRIIEIIPMNFGGETYSAVCDEEARFGQKLVSAFTKNGAPLLLGKLFICKHDSNGKEVGLDSEDIQRIRSCIRKRTYIEGEYERA